MSMQMPIDYIGIVRGFTSSHRGVDFGWNSNYGGPGHPILAADEGTVTTVVISSRNNFPEYQQGLEPAVYGTYIMIKHGSGMETIYGHLAFDSVLVKVGDKVLRGQRIGTMGNTGTSSGTHLHFEVRSNGERVNGLNYVKVQPNQVVSVNTNCKDQIQYETAPEPVNMVGNPVARDMLKDQIQVSIDILRARSGPYLMDNVLGYLRPGWYDVMEIRDMREEASNGYLWYLTNDGYWCAQVSGVVYYPKQEQPPEPDDKADWELVYNTAKKHVELQ